VLRQYTHKYTGAAVQVLLVCGPAGPTSLHPPDVCYQGVGYQMDAPPAARSFKLGARQAAADFWTCRFQKNGASPDPLTIYWAWSTTGKWIAADNPRWTFGGHPFLYKLYVIRSQSKANEPIADDSTREFLHLFLPQLQESLFDPRGQVVGSARQFIGNDATRGLS
jgi:hypothetical protein